MQRQVGRMLNLKIIATKMVDIGREGTETADSKCHPTNERPVRPILAEGGYTQHYPQVGP